MKQETNGQERGRAKNRSRDHRPADQNREKKMNRKPENRPEKTGASRPQPKASNSAAQKKNTAPGRTYRYLAYVSFKESRKVYSFGYDGEDLKVNDRVVVETVRGQELGTIVKDCEPLLVQSCGMEIKPVLRKATARDLEREQENIEKAKRALAICDECIKMLGLDMHLIEAEYTLDCSKIIFVYVADERVDFRELLKELASRFRCRIELRQVGPRNKSKIIGGLGMCGMETCCSRFLNDFDVVSINMAKNQLLALNIQKLSGQCGKLMCCLKYEDAQYKVMRQGLPKLNAQIEYKGKKYRVTSMNVLLQQAKIENKEDVQFLDFKELWPDIDFSDR